MKELLAQKAAQITELETRKTLLAEEAEELRNQTTELGKVVGRPNTIFQAQRGLVVVETATDPDDQPALDELNKQITAKAEEIVAIDAEIELIGIQVMVLSKVDGFAQYLPLAKEVANASKEEIGAVIGLLVEFWGDIYGELEEPLAKIYATHAKNQMNRFKALTDAKFTKEQAMQMLLANQTSPLAALAKLPNVNLNKK